MDEHPPFPSTLHHTHNALSSSSTLITQRPPLASPIPMNSTGSSSPPLSKSRRPSPLRNHSISSEDLERATDPQTEDDDHPSRSRSISPSPSPAFTLKKPLIPKQERTPSRRDSGSEVEDTLFATSTTLTHKDEEEHDHEAQGEMDGLNFGFSSSSSPSGSGGLDNNLKPEGGRMIVDSKEDMSGASVRSSTLPTTRMTGMTSASGRKSSKSINYNPSIDGSTYPNTHTSGKQHPPSSFIRPKPSFPRSAPLRPLTLTLSSSPGGMNLTSSSSLTGGGRYSTPHAGMMSSKLQSNGGGNVRAAQQGRQKVIVPKKGWKMSFDLGLTQSELARVA